MQKRIAKDLLTYLPAKALPALAAFLTVPIYTHLFSPAEFGNYVLAVGVSEFMLLVVIEGFSLGAIRFYSTYQRRSNLSSYFGVVFGSVGIITLASTIVSASILITIHSAIPSNLYSLLWAALALFSVSALFTTLTDVLRGQEKGLWYSIFLVSSSFGGIVFGLIFVLVFETNIVGLIWGQALGLFLPIIPLIWFTTRSVAGSPAQFNRSDFRQIWTFALPFVIANIAFWMLTISDRYIVELFRGSYEVGLYAVASKISSRSIQLLVSLFILVPVPIVSRLWEERGQQATEDALTAFTRMFLLMIVPAVVGLSVVAAPLVRILADDAYYEGYQAIWLVALASMALGLSELGRLGCLVTNHTHLIARNQCIMAITGLALNFILIPIFGFMGAAISAVVVFSLLAVLQAITSARFLTWRWPLKSLWRISVAAAAMVIAVLIVQVAIPSNTILWQVINLLTSIVIGVLTYGWGLWFLGEISPRQIHNLFLSELIRPVANQAGQR